MSVTASCRCQFPQITSEGLQDSIVHGSVYTLCFSIISILLKPVFRTSGQSTRHDLVLALLSTLRKLKFVSLSRTMICPIIIQSRCRRNEQCHHLASSFRASCSIIPAFFFAALFCQNPVIQLRLFGANLLVPGGFCTAIWVHNWEFWTTVAGALSGCCAALRQIRRSFRDLTERQRGLAHKL